MFMRKETKPHVSGRVKAYGRARLDIAQRVQSSQDWEQMWKPPMQPFAFDWGAHWKQCIEYRVDDFGAEVGFFIDILGLPVNAFNPDYAMFTSPDREFYFSVTPAVEKKKSTPPDAFRLQFMVADLFKTVQDLQTRGVNFDQEPQPLSEESQQWVASFRTPHGLSIEIWGLVEMVLDEKPDIKDHTQQNEIQRVIQLQKALEGSLVGDDFLTKPIAREDDTDSGKGEQLTGLEMDPELDTDQDEVIFVAGRKPKIFQEERASYHVNASFPQKAADSGFEEGTIKTSDPKQRTKLNNLKTGQELLDTLERRKDKRVDQAEAVQQPLSGNVTLKKRPDEDMDSTSKVFPYPKTTGFRPAPKQVQAEKKKSFLEEFDLEVDAEYIDMDEEPAADTNIERLEEYHYKPIPLNPKE